MFPRLLQLFEASMLLLAAVGLLRLRPVLRHTTLTTVWPWAWVAWTAAVVGWVLRMAGSTALVSYMDYFTAVAVLSPPLASLGARRPTCRTWPFFVLLPMFAVLCWPALSVGLATRFARPLELETPAVVMYVVVLIMAMGNYAFGRLGRSVVIFSLLLAGQVSGWSEHLLFFWPPEFQRFFPQAIAVLLIFGFHQVAESEFDSMFDAAYNDPEDRFDATLREFGELYGLVWWLRLQDRLNVFASQQKWPVRFEGRLCNWTEPVTESQRAEIERAFRWLLRRFVDPPWLDARLPSPGTPVAKEAFTSPIDS